eukprot:s180_g25.t1
MLRKSVESSVSPPETAETEFKRRWKVLLHSLGPLEDECSRLNTNRRTVSEASAVASPERVQQRPVRAHRTLESVSSCRSTPHQIVYVSFRTSLS